MITEPLISQDVLHDWLVETYPLEPPVILEFMPEGECSWNYRVTASDGTRYVLKLSRPGNCGTPSMNDHTIRTVQALYYEFGITQMTPPPLRGSTGQYINTLRDCTAVLIKYIEGTPAYQTPLDDQRQRQLGALIGRIHRSKLHPRERPMTEDFWPDLPGLLRRILDEAISPTRRYAPYHLKVLRIIQTILPRIEARLAEFLHLQKLLRDDIGLQDEFVVCHGDPSGGNVILTPDDSIALIDWDAPLFAPRERDLFFVRHQPAVMEGYHKVVGEVMLRPDVLRFYQLQWDLGEIVDYGTRILFRRQNKIQNKHDVLELLGHLKGANLLVYSG